MTIRRVVPNIKTREPELTRKFYADFLGFRVAMDMGWIVTYASISNPTAQISVLFDQNSTGMTTGLSISIEVGDVDALHAQAVSLGLPIVYPLTDEPWRVRRFVVVDPNGVEVNVMAHLDAPAVS